MSMQERTRYEEAAAAIAAEGRRVTQASLEEWLRARDGRGLSPRDGMPVVRRYRSASEPRIAEAHRAMASALAELLPWERIEAFRRLKRELGQNLRGPEGQAGRGFPL